MLQWFVHVMPVPASTNPPHMHTDNQSNCVYVQCRKLNHPCGGIRCGGAQRDNKRTDSQGNGAQKTTKQEFRGINNTADVTVGWLV